MAEILSELAPLLRENLVHHIAVLAAMALVGVPLFAAVRKLLSSGSDSLRAYRPEIRLTLQLTLALVPFLILVAMGFLLFNLLTGRYSSGKGLPTGASLPTIEYRSSHRTTDPQPQQKPTLQSQRSL